MLNLATNHVVYKSTITTFYYRLIFCVFYTKIYTDFKKGTHAINPSIKQPRWKTVEYSRTQIVNAGKIIGQDYQQIDEYKQAVTIVDNWRASHAFPLHVIYIQLRRMCSGNRKAIVAERLKRLESITKKLTRESNMNLWTMQDLGSCRVIVSKLTDVYNYATKYEKSRKRHIVKKTYDYIKAPKASGYRSLHVVYECRSDRVNTYNRNMLIEIQYRTHLQHIWATAVETMGLFTDEAIKSGQGSEDIKRFLSFSQTASTSFMNGPL